MSDHPAFHVRTGAERNLLFSPGIPAQIIIGTGLLMLLLATRGHHFPTLAALPGASWAVFFLAGVYLRPKLILAAMLLLVWTLDFVPYLFSGQQLLHLYRGGAVFCLTPAYGFLLPAYGALWLAGRWYAKHHDFSWATLPKLAIAVVVGATVCELFSSGGFYFFSGRFTDPTAAEFIERIVRYYPLYFRALTFYIVLAVLLHVIARTVSHFKSADGASKTV